MPKASQSAAELPNSFALLLGYLNFSAGAFDVSAWKSMNDLYAQFEPITVNGDIIEQSDTVCFRRSLRPVARGKDRTMFL